MVLLLLFFFFLLLLVVVRVQAYALVLVLVLIIVRGNATPLLLARVTPMSILIPVSAHLTLRVGGHVRGVLINERGRPIWALESAREAHGVAAARECSEHQKWSRATQIDGQCCT